MSINRRDIIKGLVAAPVLLQVPKERRDIITFAEEKEIITNIIDSDIYKIGPMGVIRWDVSMQQEMRMQHQVGELFERPDHILGQRFVSGSVSFYIERTPSLALLNKAMQGNIPIRMQMPTNHDNIVSTEFDALPNDVSFDMRPDQFSVAHLSFTVIGQPPLFYETT